MSEDKPTPGRDELIYDWNVADGRSGVDPPRVSFDDESLRDGLQSPSVQDPSIDEKIKILHLIESLGIQAVNVGLPAAGPRVFADTLVLARETTTMNIQPNSAGRTLIKDIEPIVEISQKIGQPIEAALFVGSSPIRFYTENWELSKLLELTHDAVTFAVKNNLPVMFVTEDTTRATPETIKALYQTAIYAGARRITIADTVGHSIPAGVTAVINYVRAIADQTNEDILIDWHGHNDRGLAVINTITAALCGADRVHGTALGIGERCGNAAMDQILVNLRLMGVIQNDLTRLPEYCEAVSRAVDVEIPCFYPVVGRDAFRTATGVHAAAVIKASKHGDAWLEDLIYSGVPASMVGREQEIEIGPMSGLANATYWLIRHGYEPDPRLVDEIFAAAKKAKAVLAHHEVEVLVQKAGGVKTPG